MSERALDRLHVPVPDGTVPGHDRTSSSFSLTSPTSGHDRTGSSCLSPVLSGPPSPTRYAPVNCEVHMLVPTIPAEEPLAEHIRVLLKETDSDPSAFQHLRDIYLQTIQPSTTASPLLKQLHCMPVTSSAIANAVQASEESSVILGSTSTSLLRSPMAQKMKSNYHQWKSTFLKTKDSEHDEESADEDGFAPMQPPITDLVVVFSGDVTPEDFEKIEKSPGGIKADLNRGRRGQFVYLCQKRETPSAFGYKRPPISDIILIYPERGECPPPNYEFVQRRGVAANLNAGVSGEKLYMCFKRSASSSITDIAVVFPKKGEKVPYGYMKIDKTPHGHSVDIHTNMEVSICYKKHIGLVEYLKPLWWHATLANSPHGPVPLNAHAPRPKTRTAFFDDGDSKGDATKAVEVVRSEMATRDKLATAPSLSRAASVNDASSDDDLSTLIKYMYPLLVSCHMRQGTIAVQAIARLETLLDSDLVKRHVMKNDAYLLTALVETINTSCQQGLRDRVPIVMGVLSKVIKQYAHEFSSVILHEVTKALLFVNDFDDGAARAALEDMIHSVIRRVDVDKNMIQANLSKLFAANHPSIASRDGLLANIVYGVASEAVTTVEIARMNENALNIIKGHSSIYSAGFCHEIQHCIKGLLQTTAECNAYQLIATLSKYATKRNCSTVDQAYEKDCASITNTLHMLDVALLSGPPVFKDHPVFGQQIRRFVCSVVNSACVMWSESVMRAALSLVTTLWNQYRLHLKVELALLFENVFLRILRSPGPTAAIFQSLVLHELMPWFQLPHNVVEIFLNFDMDRQFVQQWKVFEQFCAALCSITETSCVNGGSSDADDSNALDIGEQALSTILAILRSLMDASGHAHLILRNDKTRILSMAKGGWELDEFSSPTSPTAASQPDLSPHAATSSDEVAPQPQDDHESNPILNQKLGSIYGTVRERNELQKKSQQLLKRGMEIAETKSFKKALEYLIAMGLIKESPRDITSFLRIYHTFFDESDIGDYLGEGDEEFKLHIRLTYARAISFTGMTLVEALRHYLTHGGFKLPGEAQKIARMVEAFAQCYYEDLAGATAFSSSDTIMILAYSIIMLNTDLHNPQVKKNKMSKDQFVKNNRGIDNGNDVPKSLLEDIYDDILNTPIQLKGLAYTLPSTKPDHATNADAECEKFRMWLSKSVTQSEDLMKDLARSKFTFNFFGVDASISPDLVKILFERVWFHFLALSTTILSNNQSDLSLVLQCLDMLRYCISICVFLEMHVERQAFSNQLTKLQMSDTFGKEPLKEPASTDDHHRQQQQPEWLEGHKSSDTDPWTVIGDIHVYVNKLKDSIQKRQTVENLKSVTKRINRSHVYLHDSTQFIREGDLTKRCRTGRHRVYRFFLFNDQLLYADKGISGNFNAHQSLRLRLTRLADIPDSLLVRNAFQILNPVKSFTVIAETAPLKAEWMREIEEAIMEANKKTNINLRRLSTARGLKRENNAAIIAEAKANAKEKVDETSAPAAPMATPPEMWVAQLDV
ncbi:hypothetical protein H310_05005 [Aphanomyces invadans]|uniref:SEC7 domain-containing protein n=1 Tax=Aphanomyces invadans TaxID=157072 RepID=A0A024UB00_9STRA|nr:hypothetical protein H310_05005 [Aphanomyces invadans]ETW03596.1 hypothetical protein H310_05005 [Aphanomyces invadans]|eukprot:XP_008867825.1 hypothetical protein H310_05005 [Aphanomyces invadans]